MDLEDEGGRRGRAPAAKKQSRTRAASRSAEKAHPRSKRQRQTKKAGDNLKGVKHPAGEAEVHLASPSSQKRHVTPIRLCLLTNKIFSVV